jgi:hypothetical protein
MMDKDKLRKADIFSGGIIFLFGLWVVSQGLKMPMKDSWGGVQNVWYVSPALFPLFVGGILMILGALLVRTALKTVGFNAVKQTCAWIASSDCIRFLKLPVTIRFYAIVILFFSLVYLNIPRVDFFLGSVLFLTAFISMFYFDDDAILRKLLLFYLAGTGLTVVYFVFGLPAALGSVLPYPSDWLTLVFILVFNLYSWILVRGVPLLRKKFRTSMILAVASPFLIGPIFKYLLLVPMPKEGLIVAVMDAVWYFEF